MQRMPERHGNPLVASAQVRTFYRRYSYGNSLPRMVWLMREDDNYYYVEALNALGNPDIRPKEEKLSKNEWSLDADEASPKPMLSLEDT